MSYFSILPNIRAFDIGQKEHFLWKNGSFLRKKGTFFQKMAPKNLLPSYPVPFLSVLHQKKVLHNFRKYLRNIGLEYALNLLDIILVISLRTLYQFLSEGSIQEHSALPAGYFLYSYL